MNLVTYVADMFDEQFQRAVVMEALQQWFVQVEREDRKLYIGFPSRGLISGSITGKAMMPSYCVCEYMCVFVRT